MNRYIVPIVIMFISAGILIFLVDGGYKDVVSLKERDATLVQYIEDANTANQKLDKLLDDYNGFPKGASERLTLLMPDRVDPVKYIVDINHIAEMRGLLISQPTVSSETPSEEDPTPIIRHTLRFSVFSTYPTLKNFLHDLENSIALQDLQSIDIKVGTGADTPDGVALAKELTVLQYDITLVTYSLR